MTRLAVAVAALALAWLSMQPAPVAVQALASPVTPPAAFTGTKYAPVADWTGRINAGFYTVNCGAWGFQKGCQHWGVDIGGDGEGTPVYAPVGGWYTGCQDNGDSGPFIGKWVTYTADDGAELLINHFRDSPLCEAQAGTRIEAGDYLGTMRVYHLSPHRRAPFAASHAPLPVMTGCW